MNRAGLGAAALAGALAVHAGPALSAILPLRRRFLPGLAGVGRPGHVALTLDDGPDRDSTPWFLRTLADTRVRATFFLLGVMVDRDPGLGREIVAAGHEVAVHGWRHRNLLRCPPRVTYADIGRARDRIAAATGTTPRWYRPPYGVLTTAAVLACRRLELTPVLWTAWGRDWVSGAEPEWIQRNLTRTLADGGTVLLHDSDCASSPRAWQGALGTLPLLVRWAGRRGITLGPLAEHGLGTPRGDDPDGWRGPTRNNR
ncbi:polysaccharide deacetylase family protein [Micromonospora yangpuensis]|uniref:Polysaccharide deacetylase n=1 Tax=Micromonospora yangpuensis TaxID=683228 RepID=A0A1C6UUQ0_9ACTN|nr:polysaccharide deacetylase family protein [Micromonospora yangpuensis]SCL57814.1 Polysaccharide deacetylase [Micromonospora yangpuensis]